MSRSATPQRYFVPGAALHYLFQPTLPKDRFEEFQRSVTIEGRKTLATAHGQLRATSRTPKRPAVLPYSFGIDPQDIVRGIDEITICRNTCRWRRRSAGRRAESGEQWTRGSECDWGPSLEPRGEVRNERPSAAGCSRNPGANAASIADYLCRQEPPSRRDPPAPPRGPSTPLPAQRAVACGVHMYHPRCGNLFKECLQLRHRP